MSKKSLLVVMLVTIPWLLLGKTFVVHDGYWWQQKANWEMRHYYIRGSIAGHEAGYITGYMAAQHNAHIVFPKSDEPIMARALFSQVVKMGEELGYPKEQIVEAFNDDPVGTLRFVRQRETGLPFLPEKIRFSKEFGFYHQQMTDFYRMNPDLLDVSIANILPDFSDSTERSVAEAAEIWRKIKTRRDR